MKGRLPHLVIVGGSLTFVASLYLPWVTSDARPSQLITGGTGVQSLLNLLARNGFARNALPQFQQDGWSGFGQAAALAALALVAGAALTLRGARGARRTHLAGSCAVALYFFAILDAANLRALGLSGFIGSSPFHFAVGAYLGLASITLACFAVASLSREELTRRRSAMESAAGALTVGVLASFLIPLVTYRAPHVPHGAAFHQVIYSGDPVTILAVAIAIFALPLWRSKESWIRLSAAASLVVLAAAAWSGYGSQRHWAYQALDLVCSLALLALAAWTAEGAQRRQPTLAEAATIGAASFLLVSLFLPWKQGLSSDGWNGWQSALAGGLAIALLIGLAAGRGVRTELAIAAALYVMSAGIAATAPRGVLEYGAPLGFAGGSLLLLTALRDLRPIPAHRLIRLVPIAACLALLSFAVGADTGTSFAVQSPWQLYVLDAVVIVLALRLLLRWSSKPQAFAESFLLPVVLLVVTVLDLIEIRDRGIRWEGWASVALCLLLVGCGWAERSGGGLERFQIPEEIWRVDRISPVED